MKNRQRTKNDIETMNKREIADKLVRDNRLKNDEQTTERRLKADKILEDHRIRNDEMTTHRREVNDRNPWRTLAISLIVLATLAVGTYYYFFA